MRSWLDDINHSIQAGHLRVYEGSLTGAKRLHELGATAPRQPHLVSHEQHMANWVSAQKLKEGLARQTAERLAGEMSIDEIQMAIDERTFGSGAVSPYARDEKSIYENALKIKRNRRIEPAKALLGLIVNRRRRVR